MTEWWTVQLVNWTVQSMEEDKECGVQFESGPVQLCMFNTRRKTRRNRGNSVWKCSRGQEEEREREFVVKCEQSWEKEDIAKYQLSSNSYNTAVELLTILAIPTILQDITKYQRYLRYFKSFQSIKYLRNSWCKTNIQNVSRLELQISFWIKMR